MVTKKTTTRFLALDDEYFFMLPLYDYTTKRG
jgi:hypothetical protein